MNRTFLILALALTLLTACAMAQSHAPVIIQSSGKMVLVSSAESEVSSDGTYHLSLPPTDDRTLIVIVSRRTFQEALREAVAPPPPGGVPPPYYFGPGSGSYNYMSQDYLYPVYSLPFISF